MKKYDCRKHIIALIIFFLWVTPLFAEDIILDVKPVIQSRQIANLCAPACAEMILRFYGITNISQYDIGKELLKIDKEQNLQLANQKEYQWPNYQQTYQPSLALYFKQLGFKVRSTKTNYDKVTGQVNEKMFEGLIDSLRNGVPAIIHVEKHYMLAVGYNIEDRKLYYINPQDGQRHFISFAAFKNRNSHWYRTNRLGWDGRFLAAWQ